MAWLTVDKKPVPALMTSVTLPSAPSPPGRPAFRTAVPTTKAMRVHGLVFSVERAVAAVVVSAGVAPPDVSPLVRVKLTLPLASVVPVT